jgi:hypothetical protein
MSGDGQTPDSKPPNSTGMHASSYEFNDPQEMFPRLRCEGKELPLEAAQCDYSEQLEDLPQELAALFMLYVQQISACHPPEHEADLLVITAPLMAVGGLLGGEQAQFEHQRVRRPKRKRDGDSGSSSDSPGSDRSVELFLVSNEKPVEVGNLS